MGWWVGGLVGWWLGGLVAWWVVPVGQPWNVQSPACLSFVHFGMLKSGYPQNSAVPKHTHLGVAQNLTTGLHRFQS